MEPIERFEIQREPGRGQPDRSVFRAMNEEAIQRIECERWFANQGERLGEHEMWRYVVEGKLCRPAQTHDG